MIRWREEDPALAPPFELGSGDEAEPLARELLDLTPTDADERAHREELLERISAALRALAQSTST